METFEKYITDGKINQIRVEKAVSRIAKKHLGLASLKPRNLDSEDFKDLSVTAIKSALVAAYKAGADDTTEV